MRAVWMGSLLLVFSVSASAQDTSLDELFGESEESGASAETDGASEETSDDSPDVVELPEPAPPASASTSAKPVEIDEIIVTAQRRRETLLDVPVAVTALRAEELQDRGIGRIDDLNSLAPGLQISRSPANSTISQITIRGSSQINPAIYWDPAVGLYLDGVYIGKAQGSIFDVVDLVGVEVLRGPQGTLYGRNTIAGTINLISRKPSGEFGGHAGIELGRFNQQVMKAALDLPRFGPLALSLGGRSERRDGWVTTTDTSPVDELNNRDNQAIRISAQIDLADDLDLMYRFDDSDTDQSNNFLQLVRSDLPTAQQYISRRRQTRADIDATSFERSRTTGHALTLTWRHSDALSIKSITGARDVRWADSLDLDGTPDATAHSQRFTDYEQFSQDLNLSGETASWTYTGGYYYFADDGYTNNPLEFYEQSLNFDSRYATHADAWAVYGQVDWRGIERLTVTLGLRYTEEKKSLDRVVGQSPAPDAGYVYYISEGFSTPNARFDATTPMLSLAWKLTPQINTYVRYAEGFKSGGYNGEYSNAQDTPDDGNPETRNDNQTQTLIPFRPETQQSFEAGIKARALGGALRANLAAFHNQLQDLQASIFTGGGAAATVVRNAGEATVQGLELETSWQPLADTRLSLNLAWLDAEYDVFNDIDADGNFGNQADNRAFVHAPELAWNAVLDSRLFDGFGGEVRAIVDYVWTDAFYTYPYQLTGPGDEGYDDSRQVAENSQVQGHGLLNARLIWEQPRGWRLGLWGRNLLDEDTANNFIDFGPGLFQNLTVANFVEPRSMGLALTYNW